MENIENLRKYFCIMSEERLEKRFSVEIITGLQVVWENIKTC